LGSLSDLSLGNSSLEPVTPHHRALNSAARQKAIAYGEEVLAERAKSPSSSSRKANSEWTDGGDQQVIVLYHDGNGIQDVVVSEKSA
jgi:hypothetical protein